MRLYWHTHTADVLNGKCQFSYCNCDNYNNYSKIYVRIHIFLPRNLITWFVVKTI